MKILILLLAALPLLAASPEENVKSLLATQIEAWNRGDLQTFVTTYAPDCIFVGKEVREGSTELLAHYQKAYPTLAAMGHLTFSNMAVHILDAKVAIVTAHWHLDRDAAAGGPIGGIFSLVLRQKDGAWKIALDHTSTS